MELGSTLSQRYRLAEVLGQGSFGTTYAADDLETGERVAIKVLDLRRVDDWKAVELFEREAKVLAALDHPQIPEYIDFIPVAESHSAYLIQALAPGRSLADRLSAGEHFSQDQVRDLAAQLLDILAYLAERLPPVVHRDLKPGNVLLADDGRCYLVDFGSVRDAVEARAGGGSTVAGTFGYMAPEQLHGDANPTSDLYGLGMTLVHVLTGVEPTELERVRLKVDFRRHVTLDRGFAGFIDRLIEPMPEDRFSSPRAAARALERGADLVPKPPPVPAPFPGIVASEEDPPPPPRAAPSGVTSEALADAYARQTELAEIRKREAIARAEARKQAIAKTAAPRVVLQDDDEGFLLSIRPKPLWLRFAVQLPILLFLTGNPGFVVFGGEPFFGPSWPIFADNWVGRFVIWASFLCLLSLAIAEYRGSRLQLKIAGEHFAAWRRDPNKPIAIGKVADLRVRPSAVDASGYGSAQIGLGSRNEDFSRLSARDLATLEQAKKRLEAR